MTNYLLTVEPRRKLQNIEAFQNSLPSTAELIFESGLAYLRTRNFNFHEPGSVGCSPRIFLFDDANGTEMAEYFLGVNIVDDQGLEAKIYRAVSSQDVNISPFAASSGACLTSLQDTDELKVVKTYQFKGDQGNLSLHTLLRLEEALELYTKIRKDFKSKLKDDFNNEKLVYDFIKKGKPSQREEGVALCVSLETPNGELVLQESTAYGLDISNFTKIPAFEVIEIDPVKKRVRASLNRIPKLGLGGGNWNSIQNLGTIIEYGSTSHLGGDDYKFTFANGQLEDLTRKIQETTDRSQVLMVLFEGMDNEHFFRAVGVSTILGYAPLTDLSKATIKQQCQQLIAEHASKIAERGNEIVGIGLYDLLNKVVHRKLDGNFVERAEKEGIFYPFSEESPFSFPFT